MYNKSKDILIIIPAYNEQKDIQSVIEGLKRYGYNNILVIDDGSDDATSNIANKLDVYVVRHLLNMGLGSALATGFEVANVLEFEIIVTFDADGQHDPKDIVNLVEPIHKNEADVVIGSRMLSKKGMPWHRVLYNITANLITFIIYGFSVSDSQSGLRAFNRKACNLIKIETSKMECSSEIIYKIKKSNLKFKELKIKPIYTEYSLSKGQSLTTGIKTLFRLVLSRLSRR